MTGPLLQIKVAMQFHILFIFNFFNFTLKDVFENDDHILKTRFFHPSTGELGNKKQYADYSSNFH